MSRIGKKIIEIPLGVSVSLREGVLTVKGPHGELSRAIPYGVTVTVSPQGVSLLTDKARVSSALWGTTASLVRNMVQGVSVPYQKKLLLEGVGFRAEMSGKNIVLHLGFSHTVTISIPDRISVKIEKNTITISGVHKEEVGAFAAALRALKEPEPYKGKGMRYDNEVIRRKEGKKAKTAA